MDGKKGQNMGRMRLSVVSRRGNFSSGCTGICSFECQERSSRYVRIKSCCGETLKWNVLIFIAWLEFQAVK